MPKRITELAREWGFQQPKDLVAKLEELGIRGKRSQSSLTDDEVARVEARLGFGPKPTVTVGSERVVGERVVTERGGAGEVLAREQIVEARVRHNVIRRRTQRVEEVVKQGEHAPAADFVDDGAMLDLPEMDAGDAGLFEGGIGGATASFDDGDFGAPDFGTSEPAAAPTPTAAAESIEAETPAAPREAAAAPVEAVAPAAAAPAAAPPARAATAPAATTAPTAAPARAAAADEAPKRPEPPRSLGRAPSSAPMLDDGMRRVQVLGKINLKKPEPAPPRPRPVAGAAAAPGTTAAPTEATTDDARRKRGKRVVRKPGQFDPFGSDRGGMRGGRKPLKKRAAPGKEQKRTEITTPSARKRLVRFSEVITVGELAKAMGLKAGEVIKKLMDMGVMTTVNHVLDVDHATLVAAEFDYAVENVAFDADKEIEGPVTEAEEAELLPRDPVVTVMGHVDHGKTSLLDAIRKTEVAEGEAGGITQHIGAYTVKVHDRHITFIDTPGHAAFTSMRARGAKVTDIVILVVAADDGVMPQTIEAIAHARAAEVPIIVAVNKVDRPDSDPERVKKQLADHGLVAEDWGGDTTFVPVSAKTRQNIDQLLEMVLLQADVLDLKARRESRAKGSIIEAKLDRGRGPVATVLVQEGTLKGGDPFVVGLQFGRIRAMLDSQGRKVEEAGPSTPVEILGLSGVPEAGDAFIAVADEATARQVAEHRRGKQRQGEMAKSSKVSLDDLYKQLEKSAVKELRVVLKVDVQGSVDALKEAFSRLSNDEVQVTIMQASVGGITESDVLLASTSNAIIIGFNVRPEPKAAQLAEREGVDLRLYTIIYDAINQVRDALEGLLEPTTRERTVGRAEIRQVFSAGAGTIGGSSVLDGKIVRGGLARLLRDHAVVHQGKIGSLRRFKDDVREVASGYECGIGLEGFNDLKPGDVVEVYELEQVARRMAPAAGEKNQPIERYA
jgi:translation initiation factor IF-2